MDKIGLDLEIYSIWYEPFWQTQAFYALAGVVILIILLSIFLLIKKKFDKKVNEKLSVDDILKKLGRLSQKVQNQESLEFYRELIFLLKKFIFIQYGHDYFSKTEQELMEFLEAQNLSEEFVVNIKILMNNASNIKFANADISNSKMEEDLSKSINLVKLLNKAQMEKIS